MAGKKLNIGPLPAQTDNFERYEETVVRWDRIGIVAVVCLLVVGGLGSWVWQDNDAVNSQPALAVATETETGTVTVEERATPSAASDEQTVLVAGNGNSESDIVPAAPLAANTLASAESAPADAHSLNTLPATSAGIPAMSNKLSTSAPLIDTPAEVKTLHAGLRQASLTLTMQDRQPGPPLAQQTPMNEAGIIKVILYTEMAGLRGKILHHEWYLGDKQMARVRIPVNANNQRSYSSKFINTQMAGDWQVKVVDQGGKLYAEASFEVVAGDA